MCTKRHLFAVLALLHNLWAASGLAAPPKTETAEAAANAGDERHIGRALQDILRLHGDDIHGCYARALAPSPRLQGELLLRLWVEPGGHVARVDVLQDQTGSSLLGRCLISAMQRWQVPTLAGADETRQVVFPLAFRPDSETRIVPDTTARAVRHRHDARPGVLTDRSNGGIEARILVDHPSRASLTWIELATAAQLTQHDAPQTLELLYVLQGDAYVSGASRDAPDIASRGDLIIVPAGATRRLTARAPLELLQIFVPGGPEQAWLRPPEAATAPALHAPPHAAPTLRILRGDTIPVYLQPGGQGSAALLLDRTNIRDIAVERLHLVAGARLPAHRHERSDEIVYLLAGRAEMRLEGIERTAQAGDTVFLPAGLEHDLTAIEPIEALQCYVPGGPEQRFKAAAATPSRTGKSARSTVLPPTRPHTSKAQ